MNRIREDFLKAIDLHRETFGTDPTTLECGEILREELLRNIDSLTFYASTPGSDYKVNGVTVTVKPALDLRKGRLFNADTPGRGVEIEYID